MSTPVSIARARPATEADAKPATEAHAKPGTEMVIDCEQCAWRSTEACEDCVVTFLLDRRPDDAVVIDAVEARAVRLLGDAGLVPGLRYEDVG